VVSKVPTGIVFSDLETVFHLLKAISECCVSAESGLPPNHWLRGLVRPRSTMLFSDFGLESFSLISSLAQRLNSSALTVPGNRHSYRDANYVPQINISTMLKLRWFELLSLSAPRNMASVRTCSLYLISHGNNTAPSRVVSVLRTAVPVSVSTW
jgi:hypothetical protein